MDKNIFEITVAMYNKAIEGSRYIITPGWYSDGPEGVIGPFDTREAAAAGDTATIPLPDFSGLPSLTELTKKKYNR